MDVRYKLKIDIKLTVNKHTSYDFKPTEGPSLNSYWTMCPLMVTGPLGSLVMWFIAFSMGKVRWMGGIIQFLLVF